MGGRLQTRPGLVRRRGVRCGLRMGSASRHQVTLRVSRLNRTLFKTNRGQCKPALQMCARRVTARLDVRAGAGRCQPRIGRRCDSSASPQPAYHIMPRLQNERLPHPRIWRMQAPSGDTSSFMPSCLFPCVPKVNANRAANVSFRQLFFLKQRQRIWAFIDSHLA